MSYILNIDTAVEGASVCLSHQGQIIALAEHEVQKDSASWIQPAIQTLLKGASLTVNGLAAIAISNGPGSYTGLRVGMATAKGLCYAAGIPLLTIGTLQMMTIAALEEKAELFCPMIDARRMEVFTALYNPALQELMPPQALILNEESFADALEQQTVLFFGNGSVKFKNWVQHPNAFFKELKINAKHLVPLAHQQLKAAAFADLAYSEPFYGKAFFSPPSKPLL